MSTSTGATPSGEWTLTAYRGYRISCAPKPVPFGYYEFVHPDYDGAPDSKDRRCGLGNSVEDCQRQIDEIEDEAQEVGR